MNNRISEEESAELPEGALAYLVEPAEKGKEKSIIFVFRGTWVECQELFEKLKQRSALCTGPEHKREERRAKLVLIKNEEDWENN